MHTYNGMKIWKCRKWVVHLWSNLLFVSHDTKTCNDAAVKRRLSKR